MITKYSPCLKGFAVRSLAGPATALAAGLLMASAALGQSNYATPYTFTTMAGSPFVPSGADGSGSAARFYGPSGAVVDGSGNIYVVDQYNSTIRKITPAGAVTTLAGTAGVAGGSDGTGGAARFNNPFGVALDGSGNLIIADAINNTIRKVTPSGVVTTIAGTAGVSGSADGTGAAAQFSLPTGVAIDSSGNIFIVDDGNQTVRKMTPAGVVTTFAGTPTVAGHNDGTGTTARFKTPIGIAIDSGGNLYVGDQGNNTVRKITSAGVVTTLAGTAGQTGTADGSGTTARFNAPTGVAVDSSGNVYVTDLANDTIRKITPSGTVTTLAGYPGVIGFSDGTGTSGQFYYPAGITLDGSGNLIVADMNNNTIRKVTQAGVVSTIAGLPQTGYGDGTGAAAEFNGPAGLAVDGSGNVYVADENNDTIRKITSAGVVSTLAGLPGCAGSADGTGSAARFNYPFAVAVDSSGNLLVVDSGNNTIRKVTQAGVVTTVAGTAGATGAANGTGAAASFNNPVGIAVDGNGNLYVSEYGNLDVRKITPGGVVTTLAGIPGTVGHADGPGASATFARPAGITVDGNANVYVADYANNSIRKITPAGVVSTLAGTAGSSGDADGPEASALFYAPIGIAADANGNLFVVDQANELIREVSASGTVTTLAGTVKIVGTQNGTGGAALFNHPYYIAVDGSDNLYVADFGNNLIRMGTLNGSPRISAQPTDQYVSVGGSATFSVTASGSGTLSYQWSFNGAAISGATGSSYTVTNAQASNAGPYAVTVTNANGSVTSASAQLNVSSGTTGTRLVNIATRAQVGTGGNILIPGFVIGGSGTETLLIRADGPSLTAFGVGGALAAPSLTVTNSSGTVIASNTGWSTNANASQIASVAAQVGAFALAPNSADCAVLVSLPAGAYTVQVSGVGNTTGVALAEVYEVAYAGTRLINIATRAQVGTGGNILIPGFVIAGSGTEELLVRGDGPSLAAFGVGGALAAPSLTVTNSSGTVIASNTGWGTSSNSAQIASVGASVGAFGLATGSADSAAVINLPPGAYTMQISGVNSTTGVALAEVYEVP